MWIIYLLAHGLISVSADNSLLTYWGWSCGLFLLGSFWCTHTHLRCLLHARLHFASLYERLQWPLLLIALFCQRECSPHSRAVVRSVGQSRVRLRCERASKRAHAYCARASGRGASGFLCVRSKCKQSAHKNAQKLPLACAKKPQK